MERLSPQESGIALTVLASAKISSLLVKVYVSVAVDRNAVVEPSTEGDAEKAEALPQKARMRAEAVANFIVPGWVGEESRTTKK